MNIEKAIEKHQNDLTAIDGVIGVAVAKKNDKLVIQVHISKDSEELRGKIPKKLEGFEVDILLLDSPELF